MTPEEVLRYVGEKVGGDAGRAIHGTAQKEIDNPDQSVVARKMQPKITVTVETWKTPGGQVIYEGYRDPSGSDEYTAINQPAVKAEGTSTGTSVTERTQSAGLEELDDAGKPVTTPDTGSLWYVTHFDDGTSTKRRATPAEVKANDEARQRSRNPSGQSDAEVKAETLAANERARRDKLDEQANETRKANEQRLADAEKRLTEADKTKLRNGEIVKTADGKLLQIVNDPQTGQAKVTDVTPQVAPLPPELDNWNPDIRKPGMGTYERQQQLDAAQRPGPNGEPPLITNDQYKQAMERDRNNAADELKRITGISGVQEESGRQDTTQYGTASTNYRERMTTGGSLIKEGISAANSALPYTGGAAAAEIARSFINIFGKLMDHWAGEEPATPIKGAMIGEINKMGPLSSIAPALQQYAQPPAAPPAPTDGGVNPALAASAAGNPPNFDMQAHVNELMNDPNYSDEAKAAYMAKYPQPDTTPLAGEPPAP